MNIEEGVDLAGYSTMRLGGKASYLVHVSSKEDLVEAVKFAKSKELPIITIGIGSNIVWRDGLYNGLIIVSDIKGIDLKWQNETEALVTINSGEVWDEVVDRYAREGLTGIEALSLIPGKAGAVPVQNVGAYGQEIADTLVSLEAYDTTSGEFVTIENKDCGFGYRTSRFKSKDHGRFFIISITLRLKKANPEPPFYGAVAKYLEEHKITAYTPHLIRDVVIDIRSHKLPDPKVVNNNGSFFSNPVIPKDIYDELAKQYPDLPSWPAGGGKVKVSAAWLIEASGLKDYHDDETGMSTWPTQPLVLVNENAKSTQDLINFREMIRKTVSDKFGIKLTQEPELLPQS